MIGLQSILLQMLLKLVDNYYKLIHMVEIIVYKYYVNTRILKYCQISHNINNLINPKNRTIQILILSKCKQFLIFI